MNALSSTFAEATRAFRPNLANQWRYSAVEVAECIRFIRQHLETIEQRNERLSSGVRRHRAAYVTFARKALALRLRMYLDAVRRVSEAEDEMRRIGMAFAPSSDAWQEAA